MMTIALYVALIVWLAVQAIVVISIMYDYKLIREQMSMMQQVICDQRVDLMNLEAKVVTMASKGTRGRKQ